MNPKEALRGLVLEKKHIIIIIITCLIDKSIVQKVEKCQGNYLFKVTV